MLMSQFEAIQYLPGCWSRGMTGNIYILTNNRHIFCKKMEQFDGNLVKHFEFVLDFSLGNKTLESIIKHGENVC